MNRPYNSIELERHEALIDEEIRRYLAAHEGDKYSSNKESTDLLDDDR